jgi:hypothetical protein
MVPPLMVDLGIKFEIPPFLCYNIINKEMEETK